MLTEPNDILDLGHSQMNPVLCALGASVALWVIIGVLWPGPRELSGAVFEAASETTSETTAKIATAKALGISPLAITGPRPEPIKPPSAKSIDAALANGVRFLLKDQRPDGSWGSPEGTKGLNIYAPVPGAHDAFRTAVTSLVIWSLIDAQPLLAVDQQADVTQAIERGQDWLIERLGRLRRATPTAIYNVWGHAYSLQALVRLHGRAEGNMERQSQLHALATDQTDMLRRFAFVNGGWSYYDMLAGTQKPSGSPMSFCTATVLIALKEAEEQLGIPFPKKLTDKAIASLHRQLKPDFSFAYGEYLRMKPMHPVNRPGGSLGRTQACSLALRLYGDERVTDDVLKTWLNRLFARNGWLAIGRKRPVPHESHFAVAGYFYYYGHFYAGMCIEQLPANRRPYYQEHLAHILLPQQEPNGSWWDFPFYNYHRQYGTAMAVITLHKCR